MASLPGAIFDLVGGNPTQGEQSAFGDLSGYENNQGQQAVNAATGFYGDILSGDPSKIAQVEAPEIKAGQDQVQQQAEQNAFFGNRGGGANSSTQAAQSGQRANIIDLTGQLQQGAAAAEAGLGTNLLGQGSTNLSNEASLAEQNRQRQVGDIGGIATGIGQIAEGLFTGGATPAPSPTLGTVSDPGIAASQNYWGQGATPPNGGYIDTSGLEGSQPNFSIFDTTQQPTVTGPS